jgi:iron complex outermembrane receptor protein
MDLVQRIEIVRGPSSALYGTNGMLATINIFTKSPADSGGGRVSMETGSFGGNKLFVSSSHYLGRGINLLVAGSAFHTTGRDVFFPDLEETTQLAGRTGGVGAERGYHSFAHLTWRNWSVMANFVDRQAEAPAGWYYSNFGDPGTSSRDARNFVEASWTRPVGKHSSLRFRLSYDQFRYRGRYHQDDEEGLTSDYRDLGKGDWLGSQLSFQTPVPRVGLLTFGTQGSVDLHSTQQSYYQSSPAELMRDVSQPDRSVGIFVQQQWDFTPRWTAYLGARLDDSHLRRHYLSPRLGLVYQRSAGTVYKALYGGAFRNPSAFEQFWRPSPDLVAETMKTFEVVREQRLRPRTDLSVSVFHYRVEGLIEGVAVVEGELQYRNLSAARTTGAEVELLGRPWDRIEASAAVSLQNAHWQNAHPSPHLPNAPHVITQLRAAVPLLRQKLIVASSGRYLSARRNTTGQAGNPVLLGDVTATTSRLHPQFDLQFGIRNFTNQLTPDPVSEEHLSPWMPRPGRSAFVRLLWRVGD